MLITNAKIQFSDRPAIIEHVSIPEKCPHCGKNMSPRIYSGFSEYTHEYSDRHGIHHTGTNQKFCIVLQCVLCNSFYLGNFKADQTDANGKILNYGYIEVSYIPPITTNIPDQVDSVSDRFGGIYNQALKAKEYGLNEIYGMGLRKALEFLVKDFAIYLSKINTNDKDQEEAEKIKSQSLGQVISNDFNSFPDVIKLFRAASWIGNDETHYVRKHPDKDAEFLNKLIQVLANHVSSATIEQEAMKLVDDH